MSQRDTFHDLLQGEGGLRSTDLVALSDLSPADLREFEAEWAGATVERRRAVLSRLRELAEDNIEYNYKAIFLLALGDRDAEVRREAVEGLWEEEGLAVLQRLEELLVADRSPEVRSSAAAALGRFAYLATVGELPDARADQLREALRRAVMQAPDGSQLQMRAVETLSYFHDDPLVNEYIGRLYREGDEEEQASALVAMGRSMQPQWESAVRQELENDDARVRFQAARAAGEMALSDTVPTLGRLAEGDDLEVRESAIWALGQIGTKLATERLRTLAANGPEEVREACEEALGEVMYSGDHD